jgi:hypothetical protein
VIKGEAIMERYCAGDEKRQTGTSALPRRRRKFMFQNYFKANVTLQKLDYGIVIQIGNLVLSYLVTLIQ